MKCSRFQLLFLAIVFSSIPAALPAQGVAIWHRDYPSAVAAAQAEGKKILIVFTGTDWIEICEKFHDEILAQPAFMEAVSGRFTLLKLEYPKDNMMPREEAAQKNFLREAYRVRGYPTVVLAEAGGRPFGMNGYQTVTPAEYAAQIRKIDAAHEASLLAGREAESAEGIDKARKMRRAIPDLPGGLIVRHYRKEMEAILTLDPDDTLEERKSFGGLLAEADYAKAMQDLGKESKWAEMIALTESFVGENKLEGEALQRALFNQAVLHRRLDDKAGERAVLEKIVAIDAESETGKAARETLEKATTKTRETN